MIRSTLALAGAALLWSLTSAEAADPSQKHALQASLTPGAIHRVQLVAEAEGSVRMKRPTVGATAAENAQQAQTAENDAERSLALSTKGELQYEERVLLNDGPRQRRSVRYLRKAEASAQLGEGKFAPTLADDHRWIVSEIAPQGAILVCPFGPLTQGELDLVHPPINSLAANLVLPSEPQAVGEQWPIADEALASLFDLDAVTLSEVTARLKSVADGVAVIEFSGNFSAALKGVATEIEVVGKANFNFASQYVTWLAISYDERRAIGLGEPGVAARNRVRMIIQPVEETPAELSDESLGETLLETGPEMQLVQTQSAVCGFRLLHPRTWRVMLERHDVMVLRMVEQNDFIAQCNISPLDKLPADRRVTLEGFQIEVLKSLASFNPQPTSADEFANRGGLQVLRIGVTGMVAEVPVHWIYHHVSNEQGQRASYVFTIQDKMLERFEASDAALTETLELIHKQERKSSRAEVSQAASPAQAK